MARQLHKLAIAVSGKIGAGANPATGEAETLVYQRVRKGLGNIETPGKFDLQLRRQGAIIDKQSPAQLQGRARIAAATAAWQALTPTERGAWKAQAERLTITGYNLFVRDFCQRHPLSEYPHG